MNEDELYKAKDPDLANSLIAMRRAGKEARKLAISTNTSIIVTRDGKPVRITAQELLEEDSRADL